jgi:hypothetical protein
MEWNKKLEESERTDSILDTLSGTAKTLRSILTTFTNPTRTTGQDVTGQSARKLSETAVLEAELRKAEAISIVRHNAFC